MRSGRLDQADYPTGWRQPIRPTATIAAVLLLFTSTALAHPIDATSARHHHRHYSCKHRACFARVADRKCSNRNPRACIALAAIRYRQPLADALRVASCESGFDPVQMYPATHADTAALKALAIREDRPAGLMQFKPSTFATTPYRHRSIWRARASALAGMWMWAHGRRGEWECR